MMQYIPSAVRAFAEGEAVNSAKGTLNRLVTLRKYYTDNVLSKIKRNGDLIIGMDHKNNSNMVPLPATMIHDLNMDFKKSGISVKLYSPYPFLNGKTNILSDYESDAWEWLVKNPNNFYLVKNNNEDDTVVRVALSDTMTSKVCIDCHNTHPLSPKKDWKLGDVRGVLEASMDIKHFIAQGELLSFRIVLVLVVIFIINMLAIYILIKKEKIGQINHYNATHDTLTGLSNRLHLNERIDLAIANAERDYNSLVLLYIDLYP